MGFGEGLWERELQRWLGYRNTCHAGCKADNEEAVIQAVDTRFWFELFREPIEKFRAKNPRDWLLINELHSNWRGQHFSTFGEKFKQAMKELLEKRLRDGREQESREKMTWRALALARAVMRACRKFEIKLKPMLKRAFDSQRPEANQLNNYGEVCWAASVGMSFQGIIEEVINNRFPREMNSPTIIETMASNILLPKKSNCLCFL